MRLLPVGDGRVMPHGINNYKPAGGGLRDDWSIVTTNSTPGVLREFEALPLLLPSGPQGLAFFLGEDPGHRPDKGIGYTDLAVPREGRA